MSELHDIMDQVKRPRKAPLENQKIGPVSLEKALNSIKNAHEREVLENMFQKELKSPDMSSVRLISLYNESFMLRNESTILLNLIEGNTPFRATDFQIRYRETRIGDDVPVAFNPNSTFPDEAESNRMMRDQTIGFFGNRINIRFIASELAAQSGAYGGLAIDLVQEEIDMEMVRLRRFLNSKLISSTEVKAESVGNVPFWGGLIERTTSNNLATSGDLTNGLIQGRVDAIANATDSEGIGYNKPLVVLCPAGQIAKVEDLMIARWPGQTSDAQAVVNRELFSRVTGAGIAPEQCIVYKPRPGRPLIFIYEPQLPAGTALFFDPSDLRMVNFQMMGTFGPWVLERPTEDLRKLLYMWDGRSLLDGPVDYRASLSGLSS